MRAPIYIQSGRPNDKIEISNEAKIEVKSCYLSTLRQRFKFEINRLTSGDMCTLLKQNPFCANEAENLSFFMSYLYAWHWLQHHVHPKYQAQVLASFTKGAQGFLMVMLLDASSADNFITTYINHWKNHTGHSPLQHQQLITLLHKKSELAHFVLQAWQALSLFETTPSRRYTHLAQQEKQRYSEILAAEDIQRLTLIDNLPPVKNLTAFEKLGIIPTMACPQTCRHCMFIFRPLVKPNTNVATLFSQLDTLTHSILFTGGDLTKHLSHFYHAIETMKNISSFAILLNGDFANSLQTTQQVMEKMAHALRRRPNTFTRAKIILQISFDEFHQEIVVDKTGNLTERIPVTKIANIIESALLYSEAIQVCLLHKQGALNFSMDLFKKGVFARLVNELARRGQQVQILSTTPSARLKRNPENPSELKPLIKDAVFSLKSQPQQHFLLTSSTIDAYGRASTMALHESVNERELLNKMLAGEGTQGETFDRDIMFWFNGWATLFSAVHICLGNIFEEGLTKIRQRQAKDPLTNALYQFDTRLLKYYAQCHDDLDDIIKKSTSVHHLFHTITETSAMRLHMTKQLIASNKF